MDKSWMKQSRLSDVYDEGLIKFLDFAFQNSCYDGKIICPCKKCKLRGYVTRGVAYDHLIVDGFLEGYTTWIFHGETSSSSVQSNEAENRTEAYKEIDYQTLLRESFSILSQYPVENDIYADSGDLPQPKAEEFLRFVEDANKELYPGCKNFTKFTFIIQLFHIKCLGGWSNNSFSRLLKLLKTALPEGEALPNSFYEMKKVISKIGLGYQKIHAYPNDCILYRNDHQEKNSCPKCGNSRYVVPQSDPNNPTSSQIPSSKVPAKVLRCFPLIPRHHRLFMSSMTSHLMRWHKEERTKDGYVRHPADLPAWMTFDHKNPEFAVEPRNVKLGLSCDGMNPFKTMSTTYSVWPVILAAYNLPPWMCMESENFMLSMIIPGPGSPGNNIDVYLPPLIDELKLLWHHGVETYDSSKKKSFQMRASSYGWWLNQNQIINALQEQLKELTAKLNATKAKDVQGIVPQNMITNSTQQNPIANFTRAPDDLGPILQVARRRDWSLSMDEYCSPTPLQVQVGQEVCLKSIIRSRENVAYAVLYSTDPSNEVGEQELGRDYWEVFVQVAVKPNERLIRSFESYKTIGEVGYNVAWPKAFVNLDHFLSELHSMNLGV